jgi:hypothetical protein
MKKRKHKRLEVGPLVVHDGLMGFQITEPLTNCRVASGFPTLMHAATAAKEMNEIADWVGILKTCAQGRCPNCMNELVRIAENYGGAVCRGSNARTQAILAHVTANL